MMISLKKIKMKKHHFSKEKVAAVRIQLEEMTEESFRKFDTAKRESILDIPAGPGKE